MNLMLHENESLIRYSATKKRAPEGVRFLFDL